MITLCFREFQVRKIYLPVFDPDFDPLEGRTENIGTETTENNGTETTENLGTETTETPSTEEVLNEFFYFCSVKSKKIRGRKESREE